MPFHLVDRLWVGFFLTLCTGVVCPVLAQDGNEDAVRQYESIVVDVLEARLQADVSLEAGTVRLRTSPSRLLKAMREVVKASAPYYFKGDMRDFKKFSSRVRLAVADLDGLDIPPKPDQWAMSDWQYYQVESALRDVVLLVGMDVGVFANATLAQGVQVRQDLRRDWEDMRGGRDPLAVDPVPDFGPGVQDGSSLDGLSGVGVNGQEPPSDRAFEDLAAAIRSLAERVDQLEGGTRAPGTLPVIGGGFPERGLDGGWAQQPQASGLVQGLPERFTLQFPEGSAALSLSTEYGLNALIEWMFAYPSLRVLVTGHSDATGNARTNMELSRRRAQVVRYYLLERGVPMERVNAAHFGEGRPEWGGAFDRRVEVTLTMD